MQSPLTAVDIGPDPDYVPPPRFNGKIVKPNKFAPCKQMYEEYYECSLVKETSFGKFIGRCNSLKANLDACNMHHRELARKANFEQSKERKAMMEKLGAERERREAMAAAAEAKKNEPPPKPRSWW